MENTKKQAGTLEIWPIERLKPYARNARTHSADQVNQIAASITQFGFINPILVDPQEGIIAGHGRLMGAKQLGLKSVPVLIVDHLTPEQKRAYILADNQIALNAGWDESLLRQELEDLQLESFDLDVLGFGDDEIEKLLGDPNAISGDDEDGEGSGASYTEQYGVMITCKSSAEQTEVYNELKERGYDCKAMVS